MHVYTKKVINTLGKNHVLVLSVHNDTDNYKAIFTRVRARSEDKVTPPHLTYMILCRQARCRERIQTNAAYKGR